MDTPRCTGFFLTDARPFGYGATNGHLQPLSTRGQAKTEMGDAKRGLQGRCLMLGSQVLSSSLLIVTLMWLAGHCGEWFTHHVANSEDGDLEYNLGAVFIKSSHNQVALFVAVPVILATALGGVYQSLWVQGERAAAVEKHPVSQWGKQKRIVRTLRDILRFHVRPLGIFSPWLSIGELAALLAWVGAMLLQWDQCIDKHVVRYAERVERCASAPSGWCFTKNGEEAMTPVEYRYKRTAIAFGFLAAIQMGAGVVLAAKDSKLLPVTGISPQRAILYHRLVGFLAFLCLFLHAFLFLSQWLREGGWSVVVEESLYGSDDVNIVAGWTALLCGIPVLLTSTSFVRRRWYGIFRRVHWLFAGILLFSAMHSAHIAPYFMAGLSLYALHVCAKGDWYKRWWSPMRHPDGDDVSKTSSFVHVLTTSKYTRLVLKNPKDYASRGGAFVRVRIPGILNSGVAHPFTVALRGPPPETAIASSLLSPDKVFTVYVKAVGPWTRTLREVATRAARSVDPASVVAGVEVEGWFGQLESLTSMSERRCTGRVLAVAGGSGFTSFLGLVQDWRNMADRGNWVPTLHLVWCCRELDEMELLGESLPSLITPTASSATRGLKEPLVTLSLFCSGEMADDVESRLDVVWPARNHALPGSSEEEPLASIHDSIRTLLAGGAAYSGWLLGVYIASSLGLEDSFVSGLMSLTLMFAAVLGVPASYGLARRVLRSCMAPCWGRLKADYHVMPEEGNAAGEEGGSEHSRFVTYPVTRGRPPIRDLLRSEARMASVNGIPRVKVLVSGPRPMVDDVLLATREIDWRLFDTEAFSFEF